jgi:hypothetical protein
MIRRTLLLSLFATMPALVCAQEAKLINCRSLDAAGNFVGPDEVVVDDLVCQKVKSGATAVAAPKPEPAKPLPGTVITDEEPPSVVDAAKASAKRVAAAVQANAGKSTAPSDSATAASPAPPAPAALPETTKSSVAPEDSEVQPMGVAEAARVNAKRMAEAEVVKEKAASTPGAGPPAPLTPAGRMPFSADAAAKPQPAKISKADRAELTEPAIAPAGTPPESALMKAARAPAAPLPAPKGPAPLEATQVPAGSAPAVVDSTAPPPTEIVIMSGPSREAAAPPPEGKDPAAASTSTPEPVSSQTEIVITSAPSREAAAPPPAPETAPQPAAEAKPDAVASKPPASTEAVKGPPADAQPPASEAPSAFYDANAPKNSSNRPAVTLGVVSSPPAGAVMSPADEPPANTANATTEASPATPEAQPDAQPVWPGNAEPNLEREKVVETGTFALPKEVPDPNQPLHTKQITPSAEDGFQEGQRADCRKNITIGGLKGEKLVLGTPKWAADWIEKNQKRMLDVCFSDTPMQGARNYLIVFYTSAPGSDGAEVVNPVAPRPQGSSPAAGVGTFTTSYGSTWHYFFDRNVGVTVNSSIDADQPQSQPDKLSYATAYTEEGVPVAQHWQGTPKKQIKLNPDDPNVRKESKKERHAREEMEHFSDSLLNQMVEEIEKL